MQKETALKFQVLRQQLMYTRICKLRRLLTWCQRATLQDMNNSKLKSAFANSVSICHSCSWSNRPSCRVMRTKTATSQRRTWSTNYIQRRSNCPELYSISYSTFLARKTLLRAIRNLARGWVWSSCSLCFNYFIGVPCTQAIVQITPKNSKLLSRWRAMGTSRSRQIWCSARKIASNKFLGRSILESSRNSGTTVVPSDHLISTSMVLSHFKSSKLDAFSVESTFQSTIWKQFSRL